MQTDAMPKKRTYKKVGSKGPKVQISTTTTLAERKYWDALALHRDRYHTSMVADAMREFMKNHPLPEHLVPR